MTVETTLQRMFDFYPDLYSNRQECFNQLFCTVGNGYMWRDGQIVTCEGEDISDSELDYSKQFHVRAHQSKKNIEKRRAYLDMLVKRGIAKPGHHWYPLSKKYSLLFSVPDDVKPDWKAAVEECKQMLREDGILDDSNDVLEV